MFRLGLRLFITRYRDKVTNNKWRYLSIVAMKLSSNTPKHMARSFHNNLSYRSNCDFGSPCDCIECREASKRPVCDICRVRQTTHQSSNRFYDRKGVPDISITSFCNVCWRVHLKNEKKRHQEIKQLLSSRQNKVEKMLEYIRGLDFKEQVPIAYAVDKFMSEERSAKSFINSRRWHQRHLVDHLSQDLGIVKKQNRYVCDKRRVDAMNFKLWYFWDNLDVNV